MGSVVALYDGSQGPKAKRSQDRVNDRKQLSSMVVNEDKAVKLNDKEYNLGLLNIERIIHKTGLYSSWSRWVSLQMASTNWWLSFRDF